MLRRSGLKVVTEALNKLYPLEHADHTWDNTGLLIDATVEDDSKDTSSIARVLLAIDLTEAVATEAIENKYNLIVAYHPFLFRKFNKIQPQVDPQQRSLVRLLQAGISVYSPHTAVDAAVGGVNEWLAHSIAGGVNGIAAGTLNPIIPDKSGASGVGMGRVFKLSVETNVSELVRRIKEQLSVTHVRVAARTDAGDPLTKKVRTVAVCAGSGGGVFDELKPTEAAVLFTGELSHHEVLAATQRGQTVLLVGHTNSERGFVKKMAAALSAEGVAAAVTVSQADMAPFITV